MFWERAPLITEFVSWILICNGGVILDFLVKKLFVDGRTIPPSTSRRFLLSATHADGGSHSRKCAGHASKQIMFISSHHCGITPPTRLMNKLVLII